MSQEALPLKTYVGIYVALMVLTALTVWVAYMDFGGLNLTIALVIAGVKATLVVLWFMHVRFGGKLVRIFAGAGFFWLLILIVLSMADYISRGWGP